MKNQGQHLTSNYTHMNFLLPKFSSWTIQSKVKTIFERDKIPLLIAMFVVHTYLVSKKFILFSELDKILQRRILLSICHKNYFDLPFCKDNNIEHKWLIYLYIFFLLQGYMHWSTMPVSVSVVNLIGKLGITSSPRSMWIFLVLWGWSRLSYHY